MWEGPVVHVIMVSQPGMTSWWICVWKVIVPVFLPRHDAPRREKTGANRLISRWYTIAFELTSIILLMAEAR